MAAHFLDIVNQARSGDPEKSFMQKPILGITPSVQAYLERVGRYQALPIVYQDLLQYRFTDAVRDENGKLTHWERLSFTPEYASTLYPRLWSAIRLLDPLTAEGASIGVVDICEYGNSNPFRIQLKLANGSDRWYFLKQADSSRIFGLELAHLVGTEKLHYLVHDQTVLESAIEGTPGDQFLRQWLPGLDRDERLSLAEGFVRFCQQCYWTLLGDMRNYNWVVRLDGESPRFLPIDFDQQLHEGFPPFYSPSYFRENLGWVELVEETLLPDRIRDIEKQEQQRLVHALSSHGGRIEQLMDAFQAVPLSERHQLRGLVQAWYSDKWPTDSLPTPTELLRHHWQTLILRVPAAK